MTYLEVMNVLSECKIGMLLVDATDTIVAVNATGDKLLHGEENLVGKKLKAIAAFLCNDSQKPLYGNPQFNEYLVACPAPKIHDIPANMRILTFKKGNCEYKSSVMDNIFQHLRQAVTVWDAQGRLLMINSAGEKLESHLSQDILGKNGKALYKTNANSKLSIPQILSEKKPILNFRQDVTTHSGKELQLVSDNYPIISDGKVTGAVCIMEDASTINNLLKYIADLQQFLAVSKERDKPHQDAGSSTQYHFGDIIFAGPAVEQVIARCKLIARADSSVMIYGETGTGKELFAQSIHNASLRKNAPFIAINCAAIPTTLLESTLFGTERGAYTGAVQKKGLLELAHKGTLLLDEINSMDILLQAKLLRFLEEGVIRRVGGLKNIHIDVRIISNTNVPPLEAVAKKQLRLDLYYRLGIANITIPPLRNRKEDIPLLANTFLHITQRKIEKNIVGIDQGVIDAFCKYEWPGNVRELKHAVEYAMTILPYESDRITMEYLPDHILYAVKQAAPIQAPDDADTNKIRAVMRHSARELVAQTLFKNNQNISKSAKDLGVTRQNLQRYIKDLKLHR